ncbi:uncharacterized protein HD556DRAFT_1313237 [Suillus plorans]|uniref:Uncharacterized protein n=1 Tax=Suillus plorans TaxID=116603 RepID=A0A9P7ACQ7_9AGAM|nr:uncharacterized protein HD556DRAFT_1313237 [Suillus plorans]KAG1786744.1 hypothetical protein HD556DRAFT_1313237 [Suillus plorans]
MLSTILDSGTTSTLVCDHAMFWTYSTQDPVVVKTANHGSLHTSGRGDCVTWLKIGVRWMLSKEWECNFQGEPAHWELVYRRESLGTIPMSGHLFYVDLEFIPPQELVPLVSEPSEVSAFAWVPLTYDLWHTRMGHTGGESTPNLSLREMVTLAQSNRSLILTCTSDKLMATIATTTLASGLGAVIQSSFKLWLRARNAKDTTKTKSNTKDLSDDEVDFEAIKTLSDCLELICNAKNKVLAIVSSGIPATYVKGVLRKYAMSLRTSTAGDIEISED